MMKMVSRTLFVACVCLFLTEQASPSLGSTIVGDILIQTLENGSLFCDKLICPEGTSQCSVTKRNDPNDSKIIVRHRRCIGPNGNVLEEQKINEPNKIPGNIVNINVQSGISNSRPLTPQEKKELDDFLQKTQQQIESQVGGTLNQIYSSLGPLLDGSFANNLQKQLGNSFRNPLLL